MYLGLKLQGKANKSIKNLIIKVCLYFFLPIVSILINEQILSSIVAYSLNHLKSGPEQVLRKFLIFNARNYENSA
jgi:hypothetical protein